MNLVGKIFIVLIFIMSLCGMALTVSVYSTHRNWREVVENPKETATANKPLGLKYQLGNARAELDQVKLQHDRVLSDLESEREAHERAIVKLRAEKDNISKELGTQQKASTILEQKSREAIAAMNTTQALCEERRKEVESLRASLMATQKDWLAQLEKVAELTDINHQEVNALKSIKQLNTTLAQDNARMMEVLRQFELENDPSVYSGFPSSNVRGHVVANGPSGSLEISIGSDDSLKVGHTLDVSRGLTYLGRVRIIKVQPDRAVAQIIPEYNKGAIQPNDLVYSSLTLPKPKL